MRTLIALFAVIAVTSSASANNEANAVANDVLQCWSIPDGMKKSDSATVRFEIDRVGLATDITAVSKPENGVQRVMIEGLRRSILRCAPYSTHAAGVYEVTGDYRAKDGKSLDPYKDY